MRIILGFILFLLSWPAIGSNCPLVSYMDNAEKAEMIFIGKVDDLVGDSVQFKIYEIFKGSQRDVVTILIPDFFEKLILDEFWLVYLYKSENNELVLEECGGAKNFKMPIGLSNMYFPVPPEIELDDKSYAFWMHINRLRILDDLQMELSYLSRKKENWIIKLKVGNNEVNILEYGLILSNLLLVIIIILIIRTKRVNT